MRPGWLILVLTLAPAWGADAPTTQPDSINLDLTDAPVDKALEQLGKQVNDSLPLHPSDLFDNIPKPRITLRLRNATFWQAMKEIGQQAGLEPVGDAEQPAPRLHLGLGGGVFWRTPHCLAGPLAIFPVEVQRTTTVELGKARHRSSGTMHVSLIAYPRPGLKVLNVQPVVRLKDALDDKGQSLLPNLDAASSDFPVDAGAANNATSWSLGADLVCPANAGGKITTLRGVANLRIQSRTQRIEIDNIAKARNITREVGGTQVTLKSFRKTEGEHLVQLSFRRKGAAESAWADLKQSIAAGAVTLCDFRGRLLAVGIGECEESGEHTAEAQLHFPRDPAPGEARSGEPARLIWDAPVEARDLAVEFTLTDLPLPR